MSRQIACTGCDLLLELPSEVGKKSKICCPRCEHTITRGHSNALDYALAIVISCIFALCLSYSFDFISFEAKGQFRQISLIQATAELYVLKFYFLALLVFVLTLAFPLLYLLLLLRVLIPLKFPQRVSRMGYDTKRKPIYIIRGISKLAPWLMVDVFLIGVLVALIKMWSLASLTFGFSFWAYILFVLMFSYILYLVDQPKLLKWVNNE
ncbi:paraquat-inducible protein A [Gammaproteobacteria bacterium AS21]